MNALATTVRDLPHVGSAAGLDALFVLNNLALGGSEKKVVGIANALHGRGAGIGVCYLNGPHGLLDALDPGVPVWFLAREGKYSLSAAAALRKVVLQQHVRNVVAVNSYPTLYVAAATRCMSRRPRTLVFMNTSEYPAGQQWRRTLYRAIVGRLDHTVYGSEAQRQRWLRGAALRTRSQVIYNGVDLERFGGTDEPERSLHRRRLALDEDAFVVGTYGRLAPEKNQLVLLDAIASLRQRGIDARLLMAGDGPMREAIENRAARLRIEPAVTLTGAVADVRPVLAAMDVFVLPSLTETFSNAALEAMAMRRPVVLTRTGGAMEMVEHGREGFILGLDSLSQELTGALAALHGDRDLCHRMGSAARSRTLRDFSWQSMVDAYAALLLHPVNDGHA